MLRNAIGTVLGLMVFVISSSDWATGQQFWVRSADEAAITAAKSGKMILVSVGADWCHYCKKMDRETWLDPTVQKLIRQNYVPVKLNDKQHPELLAALKITAYPTTLIFTPDRKFVTKVEGYISSDKMVTLLEQASLSARTPSIPQLSFR